jgi:hypothetical protein
LKPLTPEASAPPAPNYEIMLNINRADLARLRRTLASERVVSGKLEAVLTRQITQLEQANDDLRSIYFAVIALRPTEKN